MLMIFRKMNQILNSSCICIAGLPTEAGSSAHKLLRLTYVRLGLIGRIFKLAPKSAKLSLQFCCGYVCVRHLNKPGSLWEWGTTNTCRGSLSHSLASYVMSKPCFHTPPSGLSNLSREYTSIICSKNTSAIKI